MRKIYVSITATWLLAGVLLPASAQPTEASESWHVLPVRSVSPSLLAWWLDPRHNAAPPDGNTEQNKLTNQQIYRLQSAGYKMSRTGFDLPTGVSFVLPATPRNEVLIFSTAVGFSALKPMIILLDRPASRMEVKAYYVEVSLNDAQVFNIPIHWTDPLDVRIQPVDLAESSFHAILGKLITQGKAMILSAPRLTMYENQKSTFETTRSKKVDITVEELPPQARKTKVNLEIVSQFSVTPTFSGVDLIALSFDVIKWMRLRTIPSLPATGIGPRKSIGVSCNVRRSRFIALTGAEMNALVPGEPLPQMEEAPQPERNVILFVTAREINNKDEK